jgi:hypothetical protein
MPPTRRRNPPSQITVMDLRPPPHRSGGKVRSATGMIGCVGPIPARVRLLPGSWSRRGSRTGIGRYGSGRVSRPGCVRGQIPAAMTPGSSARVSTAGYWLSDGPQRPAFCLVSTAFRGSVLIIPGIVGSSPTRPTDIHAGQGVGACSPILTTGSRAHTVPTLRTVTSRD